MNDLQMMNKYNLPSKIKVSVKVTPEGCFFASLRDYPGCITEAKNFAELVKNITDAVLTYFEVPRREAEKFNIVYLPPDILSPAIDPIDKLIKYQEKGQEHRNIAVMFNYFSSLNGNYSSLR